MADADKVATFQSICSTDAETATHVLESFGGDLDRAVNFFLENGEQGVATLQSFRPPEPQRAAERPAPIDLEDEPIIVPTQSPDQQQAARDEAAALHRRNQGWIEEEAALQQALEASKVTAAGASIAACAPCMLCLKFKFCHGVWSLRRCTAWLTPADVTRLVYLQAARVAAAPEAPRHQAVQRRSATAPPNG